MAKNVLLKRKTSSGYDELLPKTSWDQIIDKPTSYPVEDHTHQGSDIIDGDFSNIDSLSLSGPITATDNGQALELQTTGSPYLRFDLGGSDSGGDYRIYSWGSNRNLSLESMGDVSINIDYNDNDTNKKFSVRKDGEGGGGGTELFSVNEDGTVSVGGDEVYHEGHKPTAGEVGARPDDWVPSWGDVTSKPSTFAPETHDNSAHSENYATGDNFNNSGSYSNLDAGSVDGYDIEKNGSDGSGVINFKT